MLMVHPTSHYISDGNSLHCDKDSEFVDWERDSPVSNIGTSNATTEDKKTTTSDKKRTNGVLGDHDKGAAIAGSGGESGRVLLMLVSFAGCQPIT
jgi:hypothetical protein